MASDGDRSMMGFMVTNLMTGAIRALCGETAHMDRQLQPAKCHDVSRLTCAKRKPKSMTHTHIERETVWVIVTLINSILNTLIHFCELLIAKLNLVFTARFLPKMNAFTG